MAAVAEPVTEPRRMRLLAAPAVAGVLVAVACRLPHVRDLTLFDVDAYLAVAQQWWEGDVPYRDLFDNKGPFLYELYAALVLVLPRSLAWLYVFGMVAFALSVVQMAALAGRHLGRLGAWCATVAYAIGGSAVAYQGPEPNSDQLAMLFVVAAVDFADRGGRRWAAAAGVAIALAAGIKLSFVAMAPILLVLAWPRVVPLAAGFLAATALTLLPFALTGTLGDARFVLFDYTDGYLRAGWDGVAAMSPGGKLGWALTFPGVSLLLAGLVLGVAAWRDRATRRVALLGAAWLLVAYVVARSTGRSYAHYFVGCAPPLALLVGAGVEALGRRGSGVLVAALALAAGCLPLAVDNFRSALLIPAEIRYMDDRLPWLRSSAQAADVLRDVTEPGDRLFVATGGGATNGGTYFYWLADLKPAYRIFYPADVVPRRYDEVSAALAENPPDALVWIPGTPKAPYEAALANGRLRLVASLLGADGEALEVYAR